MTQSSGRSSATSENRLRTARPTRNRSAARRAQPEGAAQRVALWGRDALEAVEHRGAQLVQARERELHLRFEARGADNAQVARGLRAYSSTAVLPTPGSPRTTSAALSWWRSASRSRSSALHSPVRSRSTRGRLSMGRVAMCQAEATDVTRRAHRWRRDASAGD
jgi:hypothetical protein